MPSQANLPLKIFTPLGDDAVLLEGFTGRDALSELFEYRLELLYPGSGGLDFANLLGASVSVSVRTAGGTRWFNGIIAELEQADRFQAKDGWLIRYQAVMVPRLWLLTKRITSRVFQHVAVPDVLAEVFRPYGLDIDFRLATPASGFPVCPVKTQYRETDFAFASRLMEDDGIRYWFEHRQEEKKADARHWLVLSNASRAVLSLNGVTDPADNTPSPVRYATSPRPDDEVVTRWLKRQTIRSTRVALTDYHFQNPKQHFKAVRVSPASVVAGDITHDVPRMTLPVYDHPGGYAQQFDRVTASGSVGADPTSGILEEASRKAAILLERETWPGLVVTGAGTDRRFTSGYRFDLTDHFDADGGYALLEVTHRAAQPGLGRSGAPQAFTYTNEFRCIPDGVSYRPPAVTPRPRIDGVQTAVVVSYKDNSAPYVEPFDTVFAPVPGAGAAPTSPPPAKDSKDAKDSDDSSKQDMAIDEFGRVKVRFPWDAGAASNPASWCWVRVAQSWAGNHYGAFFWPRPGHEVVVAFTNGDPDQPLIVGSVYNQDNMPPFDLPDYRLASGFRTQSFGGKTGSDFSGLVFSDKAGREVFQVHSQSSHVTTAETDKYEHVFGNEQRVVGTLPIPDPTDVTPDPTVHANTGFDWANTLYDKLPSALTGNLPGMFGGMTELILGDYNLATHGLPGGGRSTHLSSSDMRLAYDLTGMFLGPLFALFEKYPHWKLVGSTGSPTSGIGGQIFGFFSGSSGLLDTAFMDYKRFVYGKRTSVQRGLALDGHSNWTYGPMPKAVKVLSAVTVLSAFAGHALAGIFASKAKFFMDAFGLAGGLLNLGGLSGKLWAVLQILETNAVAAEASLDKALESFRVLKNVYPGVDPISLRFFAAQAVVGLAERLGQKSLWLADRIGDGRDKDTAKQIQAEFGKTGEPAKGGTYHVSDGIYSVGASDITLLARQTPGSESKSAQSVITVFAEGATVSRDNGLLLMGGSQMGSLQSGQSQVAVFSKTKPRAEGVLLSASSTGKIEIVQGEAKIGRSIQCTPKALSIDGGLAPVKVHSTTEIELLAGPADAPDACGMLKLTPAGVEIKGLTLKLKGDVSVSVESAIQQLKTTLSKMQAQINELHQTVNKVSSDAITVIGP